MEENVSNDKQKAQIAKKDTLDKLDFKMDAIKIADKEKAIKAKAAQAGYNYINLSNFPITPETLRIINKEDVEKYRIVCFYYSAKQVRIGIVNLNDKNTIQFISQLKKQFHNKSFQIYLISDHSFSKILHLYDQLPKIKTVKQIIQITEEDLLKFKNVKNFNQITESLKKVSLTEILNLLLSSAINIDASDIHIEAGKDDVKIRYRVDGTLHNAAMMDKKKWDVLVSRIKLISGLKINISNEPQDGRFTISFGNDQIDVRVSTLPTVYGESVAIRILMFSRQSFTLPELGLSKEIYKTLKNGISRPNGIIFNTGPTGSGKTSTLYAILNELNQENVKIITVEDPIEYRMSGINQSQVDEENGYGFAKAMRSLVRQDPDIIMVGEIRDPETADTAIQTALTGHLVLSTVHTNSAAGAIPRILSLGVKNFLLAPALNMIIGQRLVRKVCLACREKTTLSEKEKKQVQEIFSSAPAEIKNRIDLNKLDQTIFYKAKGCDKCNNIGYKGRIGIFEIIDIDDEIKSTIAHNINISEEDIKKITTKKQFINIKQDGILKVIDGITTMEEIFRVV